MAEENWNKNNVNEELIDNLTKNLESNCIETNVEEKSDITSKNYDDTIDMDKLKNIEKTITNEEVIDNLTKNPQSNCIETEEESDITSKNDEETDITSKNYDDTINLDELKELEKSMTNEEIENNRKYAKELKIKGNDEFNEKNYEKSIITYTEALKICPTSSPNERAILYANRAASKTHLNKNESAIEDCTRSILLNSKYIKAYLRRANLYEKSEKLNEALEDHQKILQLNPHATDSQQAVIRLYEKLEKHEKMKEEMLDKLKDLGNMFLKPFGLSTNNFKMTQDPTTGGYSVNFQQNRPN